MPDRLVTGIAETSNPQELEEQFGGITNIVPTDKLTVITSSAWTEEHEDSPLNFIHPAGAEHITTDAAHEVISGGEAILTSIDGTQVPNISADSRYIGFFEEPHIVDFLSGYDIPESDRQNYNEAVASGRSVVVYKADTDETQPVEQSFREAGLKNVRTY